MDITARLNKLPGSAQKTRLVADQIRGRGVEEALAILDLSAKRSARAMAKLVRSAGTSARTVKNSSPWRRRATSKWVSLLALSVQLRSIRV